MALCCGANWHHRENCNIKLHNYTLSCTQLPKNIMENLLPMWLLMRTNLFITSHFWTPNAKFDNCCWHYIAKCRKKFWQFAVAPSDAAEKNCNIGAQLQSLICIKPQRCFGKFTSCMTFGAHKLVHSEPIFGLHTNLFILSRFLDYLYKLWHLLSALYSDMQKKFLYRCTSTFLVLNCCSGIFLNLSAKYTKWCAQTFPPFFWTFCNIWPQFREYCGAI